MLKKSCWFTTRVESLWTAVVKGLVPLEVKKYQIFSSKRSCRGFQISNGELVINTVKIKYIGCADKRAIIFYIKKVVLEIRTFMQ
jgi:hypothetical protein